MTGFCKFLLILLHLFAFNTYAQEQPRPEWVKNIGGTGESKVTGIAIDLSNNVYVAGDFRDELTVDLSGVSTPAQLISNGDYDIFVAKYTPDGRLLWAKAIGGSGWDQVNNLAVDNNGNVVMSAYFESSLIDADPDAGIANFVNNGGPDALVIKFDTNGQYAWARAVGGNGTEFGHQVVTDALGNVIFTGSFSSSTINLTSHVLSTNGGLDAFIIKYDSNGNLLWAYNMGSNDNDEFINIKTNSSQEILVIGSFNGDVDLNPASPGTLISNSGKNHFLCKYSPSGALIWVNKTEGGSDTRVSSMAVSVNNEIIITGDYADQLMFSAQTTQPLVITNPGRNLFLTKYNNNGDPVWASNIAASSTQSLSYNITTDLNNNVYMGGYFGIGLTFGSGSNTKSMTNNGRDTFCAKYDVAGNFVWAFNFGSTCNSNYAHKIAVDSESKILLGGMFCNTVDFDPGTCVLNLTARHGVGDGYLAKFDQIIPGTEPLITAASIPQQLGQTEIDAATRTIVIKVPPGTNLNRLRPILTLNSGTITPASGIEADLSNPKTYVVSQSCFDYPWTLSVTISQHNLTQANAGTDLAICSTSTANLSANHPATDETGTWSVISPLSYQPFNSSNIHDPNARISNIPQDTEVILKWTITFPPDGTSTSATVKISNYNQTIAIAGADAFVCGGSTIQLDANVPKSTETGTWSVTGSSNYQPFSAQNIHDPKALILNYPQNEEVIFTWTIENTVCNTETHDEVRIISYKDINLGAPASLYIKNDQPVNLGVTADLDPRQTYDIEWSPKTGLSSYTILSPDASPAKDTQYTLTIRYGQNCVKITTINVMALRDFQIPNSFSPNNDGKNDTWLVKNLKAYPGSKATVFNRYGSPVYHAGHNTEAWDGTYQGKPLPSGTYYYVIILNDTERSVYKGSITILR